jgi:hypothetical protein
MKTVTIKLKSDKPSQPLDFMTWKDDRRSFYARPHNGKPCVVNLAPPAGIMWEEEPLPECAPVAITHCRLLPPPCRASENDGAASVSEAWETVYWKTHGQFLRLTPDDDSRLRQLLAEYKAAALEEYNDGILAAKQIEDVAERSRRIEALEIKYNSPLHTAHRLGMAGDLNMSLGMVKRGCGELPGNLPGRSCIRDAYLVLSWAKTKNIDLDEMDRNREEFRIEIKRRAGRPALIHDPRIKPNRESLISPECWSDGYSEFLCACAAVRYRVEFAGKPAVYLADCEVRHDLRPEEWKELKRDLGYETPHERNVREGRQKGGERSRKVKDPLTVKEIAKRVHASLQGTPPMKKTTAAKAATRWAKERFGVKITYKTALAYTEKVYGKLGNGKH